MENCADLFDSKGTQRCGLCHVHGHSYLKDKADPKTEGLCAAITCFGATYPVASFNPDCCERYSVTGQIQ